MRLLLDVDGVVADFVGAAAREYEHVTRLKPPPCTTCKVFDSWLCHSWERRAIESRIAKLGWAQEIKPYPDAKEGVARLLLRHDIAWVTSPYAPSPTWAWDRTQWLRKHFPKEIPIVSTADKYLIEGVLVADKIANIEQHEYADKQALLWDRPWNQDFHYHSIRVRGWDDLLKRTSS